MNLLFISYLQVWCNFEMIWINLILLYSKINIKHNQIMGWDIGVGERDTRIEEEACKRPPSEYSRISRID